MPQVPKLREVAPRPIGTPYQSAAAATPDAFGAPQGRALQGFGQALTNTGNVLYQNDIKDRIEENARHAKELEIQFSQEKRKLLYENGGLYTLQGENAVGQAPAFKQRVHDLRQKLMDSAQNDKVRELFGLSSSASINTEFTQADTFVQREKKVAQTTVSQARMKEAIDDATAAPHNPDILARSRAILDNEVYAQAEIQGWAPEVVQSKKEEAQTALFKNMVVGLIKSGRVSEANALFNQVSTNMDAPVAAEVKYMLTQASDVVEAQTHTDAIMADPKLTNLTERLQAARALPVGKVRDDVVKRVKARTKEESDVRKSQIETIAADVSTRIEQGDSLDNYAIDNPIQFMALSQDPETMKKLRAAEVAYSDRRTFATASDGETLLGYQSMSPRELAQVSDNQLKLDRPNLTDGEWKTLGSMVKAAKSSQQSDSESYAAFTRAETVLGRLAPKDFKWSDKKASEAHKQMQQQITNQMYAYVQEKIDNNEPISNADIVQQANNLFARMVSKNGFHPLEWAGWSTPAYGSDFVNMSAEDQRNYTIDIESLDPTYVSRVKGAFARFGNNAPTDDQISAFATADLQRDGAAQLRLLNAAKSKAAAAPSPVVPTSPVAQAPAPAPTPAPQVSLVPEQVMQNIPLKFKDNPPRGVRNNNPGNIRLSPTQWQGEVAGTDTAFETFATPQDGIRAIQKIMVTYHDHYKLNSVADLIGRWAPPNENDTGAYEKFVAKHIGVTVDEPINVKNVDVATKLVSAIIAFENGFNPYPDDMIRQGIEAALK